MSFSLRDILARDVKRMVQSLGGHEKCNLYPLIMQEVEKTLIQLVLQETGHNHLRTSHILGIGRSTLYRRIKVLNIQDEKGVILTKVVEEGITP